MATSWATESSRRSIVLCARTLSSELKLTPNSLESSHGNQKQFPHSKDYYATHNRDYFDTSKPSGYVWRTSNAVCPGLEQFIDSFKRDTMQTAASIAKRKLRIKPNLLSTERTMIRTMLNKKVGFNISDKKLLSGSLSRTMQKTFVGCKGHLL